MCAISVTAELRDDLLCSQVKSRAGYLPPERSEKTSLKGINAIRNRAEVEQINFLRRRCLSLIFVNA